MSGERVRHEGHLVDPVPLAGAIFELFPGAFGPARRRRKPATTLRQLTMCFNDLAPEPNSKGFAMKTRNDDGRGYPQPTLSCNIAAMISSRALRCAANDRG
jgi:hypothetical protein